LNGNKVKSAVERFLLNLIITSDQSMETTPELVSRPSSLPRSEPLLTEHEKSPECSGNDRSDPDIHWMYLALECAHRAWEAGEVPVGAILVKDDSLIAEGWNCPISTHDPTAHAEIMALREGGKKLDNYRLVDTTLYVTLEPCAMCMTALVHARVKRLVFGALDPKRGAVCSALQLADAEFLNHKLEYRSGVLVNECSALLKGFFQKKRL
jgi:tRNA(adenine34) deaminase